MTTHGETTATTRSIWKLDPNHTLVEFSGKHMMFTTVKGHFKNVNGTIVLDEADPSRSSVEGLTRPAPRWKWRSTHRPCIRAWNIATPT